ncbi:MAG TPA: hypothetical protein DCX32_01690 [Candidatus Moranbacteria bacterium]|nr:MAG: Glycosyl transferase group 1 [Candidatus Moranbacteria bacterium GW2011_GWC2_45_10]KKT93820.1 MAG: Glycosyl transferase group 1 [Parcubacteria group bacterium GW2011_GWC1_45_14]HAV11234.1 hypothetical protein [Candidatus Moranbacteria bacterium]
MRILFFNYEYPPLGGGAANATEYVLREYAKLPDLEVDLVTSSIDSQYHLDRIGENVRIHRLPIGKNKKNLHYQSQKDLVVYAWKAYWFSKKLFEENTYDLTHSFFTVPCGAISLAFQLTRKVPYVISLRGSDVPGYSERFSALYWILKPLIRVIWSRAAFVVANSEDLRELALETDKKKEIKVIYNGVDILKFSPKKESRPSDKFIITLGGTRITARKGISYLIEAVEKIQGKYPQIFVKILGDGSDREDLEKMVKDLKLDDRIVFIGRVPSEEIPPYYQEASLFVLPSLNEGMSNAMLEALASGLPIISTDTGGANELVEEGKNGFLVKMKDSDDIAEKICKIVGDRELVENMGEESRRLAEKMSWEKVAGRYVELYGNILNNS